MKNFKNTIFLSVLITFLTSCSNTSEDDLTINESNPTYTNKIASIMNANCTNCHGSTPTNGANVALNTYESVKFAVENIDLICRIKGNDCGSQMPLGGQLTQNSIAEIELWETNNFPEN